MPPGDEICCHLSHSCWDALLNPLAAKFRALLGPEKILYTNECGTAIAGRNQSQGPGHPTQPPIRAISLDLSHISIDLYAGYDPDSQLWNGSAEVAMARSFVREQLYPRMHPGQLAILVPGSGQSPSRALI